jgi:hypothetical protein
MLESGIINKGGVSMSVRDIENAIREIIVKKHDETVTLFMVRGEYDAVRNFIEDCDKRMRAECRKMFSGGTT